MKANRMRYFLTALAFGIAGYAAQAQEFTYVLTGSASVSAPENAVAEITIDVTGEMTITAEGAISGGGTLTYLYARKCAWKAPDGSINNNCRLDSVTDGSFTIGGEVLEWIHRHDDANPLKDAIFAFADAKASERPDYAPLTISLVLTPEAMPAEHLRIWGLSGGNEVDRDTGAAEAGIWVSGAFGEPFELIALNTEAKVAVPEDAHKRSFVGHANPGTPVTAFGQLMLSSIARHWLPSATDPMVYISNWADAPDRDFTSDEQEAIDAYAEDPAAFDTRNGLAGEIFVEIGVILGEDRVNPDVQAIVDVLNLLPGLKLD